MLPQVTLASFVHSAAGAVHAFLAMLCIAVGLIQFLRPKRGAGHRARGYLYVYAMLVADGTAMLVYRFTGAFNLFHVGAIANFICIVLAVVPLLRAPCFFRVDQSPNPALRTGQRKWPATFASRRVTRAI